MPLYVSIPLVLYILVSTFLVIGLLIASRTHADRITEMHNALDKAYEDIDQLALEVNKNKQLLAKLKKLDY